jgi:hypothetical protein
MEETKEIKIYFPARKQHQTLHIYQIYIINKCHEIIEKNYKKMISAYDLRGNFSMRDTSGRIEEDDYYVSILPPYGEKNEYIRDQLIRVREQVSTLPEKIPPPLPIPQEIEDNDEWKQRMTREIEETLKRSKQDKEELRQERVAEFRQTKGKLMLQKIPLIKPLQYIIINFTSPR